MNPRQWSRVSGSVAAALSVMGASILLTASLPALAQSAYTVPGTTAVGATSATQTVTVNITTSGMLKTIVALAQGAFGDYVPATGGTCAIGAPYTAPTTCTVKFTFAPAHPWVRYGGISLFDGSNNLLGSVFLNGTGTGPQVVYPLSAATVPAALGSGFTSPSGIAVDGSGNVYVADTANTQIVKIAAVGGTITTLGSGFFRPGGVAVDGGGNVYVADTGNGEVKEIVFGNGNILQLGSGFLSPAGVAVDGSGNIYVADTTNTKIVEIAVNGTQSTLGSGFSSPSGVAVDGSGNVYVADNGNSKVKEIAAAGGAITTLGSGFTTPAGVAVDGGGNVYVTDTTNNAVVEVVAGSSTPVTLGSGFKAPAGVAVDSNGNVYVADTGNSQPEEMNAQTPPALNFAATAVGATSADSPKTVTVANAGNRPLVFSIPTTFTNPVASANFSISPSSTCPQLTPSSPNTASLAAGANCTDIVSFTPVQGTTSSTLATTDNNLNVAGSTQSITLIGTATPGQLTVNVSPASVAVNTASVNLTATIGYGGVAPTGAVTFTVNGGSAIPATHCTSSPSPLTCTLTYNPSALTVAGYSIAVNVAADGNYSSGNGNGTLTITQGTPALTLTTSGSPSVVNNSVTFTVAVLPNIGITPTGKMSFSTTLGGVTTPIAGCSAVSLVSGAGPTLTATCTPVTTLLAGSNTISATLASDNNFVSATSNTLPQTVNPAVATLTLATSGSPSTVNGSVSFTATLSGVPFVPTAPNGKVNFTVDGVSIGGCSAVAIIAQQAMCTTPALLAAVSHSIQASYSSDNNFTAPNSNIVSQMVNPAATTLSIPAPSASISVDASVPPSFTATLSSTAGFTPTAPAGTISFTLNGAAIAACSGMSLNSNHAASCSTSLLVAPSDVISATYSNDANFQNSPAPAVTQVVTQNTPTASVTASPSSAVVNQTVTLTATITPGGGASATSVKPTGSVTFTQGSGGPTLCGGAVVVTSNANGTGTASCSTPFTGPSTAAIYAVYSGDTNFSPPATSPNTPDTVSTAPSKTTINSNLGTVGVSVGVNGSITLSGTVVPANAGVGYAGTATPQTGTVTFSDTVGTTTTTACTAVLTNGVLASCPPYTLTALGTHTITASYSNSAGASTDPDFQSSIAANQASFTVTVTTSGIALGVSQTSGPASPYVNQSDTFTAAFTNFPANVTGGSPGTVTYYDGAAVIAGCSAANNVTVSGATATIPPCPDTFLLAGQHSISAQFAPNANGTLQNFASLTSPAVAVNVGKNTPSSITVSSTLPTTAVVDQTVTFNTTITPTLNSASGAVPTGTVSFNSGSAGGPTVCGPVAVTGAANGTATASCSVAFTSPFAATGIYAVYSGDSNFSAGSSALSVSQTVSKAPTATTASSSAGNSSSNPVGINVNVALSGTVVPANTGSGYPGTAVPQTGTVTFSDTINGTTITACTTSLTNGVVTPCTYALTTVGTHTITAAYTTSSDPNFVSSVAANQGGILVYVGTGGTSLTISQTSGPASPTINQQDVFLATAANLPSNLTGMTITYYDSYKGGAATAILGCSGLNVTYSGTGTQVTIPPCPETFSPTAPQTVVGPHSISATFTATSGSLQSLPSSNTIPITVSKTATTVAFTAPTVATSTTDQTVTFTATVTPAVTGTNPTGTITFAVTGPTGVTCTTSPVAVSTTMAGVTSASCPIALPLAGAYTITATYSGDSNFTAPVATPFIQTVTPTLLILSATPPSAALNAPTNFTASVLSQPSGPQIPTGTITFTDTSTNLGTNCTAAVATTATPPMPIAQPSCKMTLTTGGMHTITVSYGGDSNFTAASITENVNVMLANPTIQISSNSPIINSSGNFIVATQPVTFTAQVIGVAGGVAPSGTTGAFTFAVTQGSNSFACPTSKLATTGNVVAASCMVAFPSAVSGNVSVNLNYAGDTNYNGTSNSQGFVETVQNFAPTAAPAAITLTQGSANIAFPPALPSTTLQLPADPYNLAPIQVSPNWSTSFTDPTAVTCSVTQLVNNVPTPVAGLTCTPVPSPTATTGAVYITAASTVPAGSAYTLNLTVSDTVATGLSHSVTASLTIVNQAPTVYVGSLGTVTANIIVPSSVTATSLSCSPTVATLLNGVYSTTTGATLGSNGIGVVCSDFTLAAPQPSGLPAGYSAYTFTIQAGTQSAARLETGNAGMVLAGLGAPFLLMLGLLPASGRLRKMMLRSLAVAVVGLLAIYATGCGSGGFPVPQGTHATGGSYLIDVVNAQGTTEAEIPLVVAN